MWNKSFTSSAICDQTFSFTLNLNKNALSCGESRLFVDTIRSEEANRAGAFVIRRGGGGGTAYKGLEMLLVLLRGVNFGFWSHLRCSGQNAIIFSCEDLV